MYLPPYALPSQPDCLWYLANQDVQWPQLFLASYIIPPMSLPKGQRSAGLNPDTDQILELAVLITDGDLSGPHLEV